MLLEDLAWRDGRALEGAVRPLEPLAEVDRECSVDIFVLFEVVWRWGGGIGVDLAVIGDPRSIASL